MNNGTKPLCYKRGYIISKPLSCFMPYLDVRYGKNCHLTKKDMFLIGAKLKTNTNAIRFQINYF